MRAATIGRPLSDSHERNDLMTEPPHGNAISAAAPARGTGALAPGQHHRSTRLSRRESAARERAASNLAACTSVTAAPAPVTARPARQGHPGGGLLSGGAREACLLACRKQDRARHGRPQAYAELRRIRQARVLPLLYGRLQRALAWLWGGSLRGPPCFARRACVALRHAGTS